MIKTDDLVLSVYDFRTNPQWVIEAISLWLNGRMSGTFTISQVGDIPEEEKQ